MTIARIDRRMVAAALLGLALSGAAQAQAFGSGPPGTPTNSSMAGARIVGAPRAPAGIRIPNAPVFGDTAEKRAYGQDVDDSYIKPRVRTGIRSGRGTEEEATAGRSDLNPVNSGAYARQGPTAIGKSAISRNSTFSRGGRARIVKPTK